MFKQLKDRVDSIENESVRFMLGVLAIAFVAFLIIGFVISLVAGFPVGFIFSGWLAVVGLGMCALMVICNKIIEWI